MADLDSENQLCGHIPWYTEALAFCLDHAQLGWYELMIRGEKTYITVEEAVENASQEREDHDLAEIERRPAKGS